ncbi:MAG: prolyl-tRNA synthetase [Candidatus Zambryskibacteria bacterium CG_4_9_14_3_um_filter_42_9]|uniref:Proline--tRNA ligase n=1 Tax=Candidatus Zambryskibacteria bacterium CG22_combo_CG10-13_8_21_14_all_42_17 TaxID=1975118 RepID=A0A2H0BE60_9BACT|nr:MAG: prolyl-tRNA synthetase [Candidatus Zambryskibacteria bacterium CG22_combo_CG10-13_8_21_14_all_42_17]PJA36859.1 MAG: prolyl-tRNA synthetase [Candidatus Zambryskibacteria bacterium CG_4_9_14_3_um_filter_42_9]
MRQSKLFTKTRREVPKDEEAKNAILLIRAGFIHKEMAGVYSFLPLGLSVIKKIKNIISEEMEALGSQEIIMSTLQNKNIWEKTDRWDDKKIDIWFKSAFQNGSEVGFGWSHEEPIVEMMKSHISSYQNLPVKVHQFQNKLRNEVRAKGGIMRCREFIMKDMYCFAMTEEDNMQFYNITKEAYLNVFRRVGLGEITFVTSASGGVFTDKFSHEFQTICETGEDIIYVHKDKILALNEEIFNEENLSKLGVEKSDFEMKKAAEVGNIFNFGTEKSEQLGLYVSDHNGDKKPVFLSSYGIGVTRLMGTVAEVFSDENGLSWPEEISPYDVHLLLLSDKAKDLADKAYNELTSLGIEVLYDDRNLRAGEKFADSDLIGISKRLIIGEKNLNSKIFELKIRSTGETKETTLAQLIDEFRK